MRLARRSKARPPAHLETGQALDPVLFKELEPATHCVVVQQNASATSWQLHPSSKSTAALSRRVTRAAADPSRANTISLLRSSSLRKQPRNVLIGIRQTA